NPLTCRESHSLSLRHLPVAALIRAAQNPAIGAFVVTRLLALRSFAPRRDRMTAARGFTFTTAMGMVDRVHDHAAHGRTDALPAVAAGFADLFVEMVGVRHRADRRHAILRHDARFARIELDLHDAGITTDDLNVSASRTSKLTALADLEFDIVNDG